MADYIYGAQTPATNDFDFDSHSLAIEYTVSAACDAIGGRAWVPNTRPPIFFWQLWRVSDWAMLAEVDLNDPAFGTPPTAAWLDFTSASFITPGNVPQATSTAYAVGIHSDGGDFVYTSPGSYPIGTGLAVATTGRFATGGLRTDPPINTFNAFYFADVLVEAPVGRRTVIAPVTAAHRAGSW